MLKLLSSPLHPPTPSTQLIRERFSAIITHSDTPERARLATVSKLIDFTNGVIHEKQLLLEENRHLRQHHEARKARRDRAGASKQLCSTAIVLEVDELKKLVDERRAEDEAREAAKL